MSCSQNSLQMSSRFSQQTIAFSSYFFVPQTLYSFPYGARSWAALLQDTLRHTAGCWAGPAMALGPGKEALSSRLASHSSPFASCLFFP